ncbi:MAG: glucose-6-phosphate dehydrogenase assembly protein OpcA [Planctomycetes bacterium]|nr:glucose-6-phosphate dehydrogenase assembly protein OpcA [Planctomycetota bacterium]
MDLIRVAPRPTTPADLPDALRGLWSAAGDDGGDVTRAVTMNFVALARDGEMLTEVAERLMRRSPARAFLLTIDDSLDEPVTAVAAVLRCSGVSKCRDVLIEEIRIRLPQSWFSHVPGLVRPLLIHDLPTHLYVADLFGIDGAGPGDWTDSRELAALRALSDHCIIDSRRFRVPGVQLAAIAELRANGPPITDLSTLRLRPWRRALAEGFERVEWRPGTAVRGIVRHGESGTAAAILLAQWLEAKLAARIQLEASGQDDEPCPESVSLRFCDCEIVVSAGAGCLMLHVTVHDRCYLPTRLPRSSSGDGDLLAAAIDLA